MKIYNKLPGDKKTVIEKDVKCHLNCTNGQLSQLTFLLTLGCP